jgi:hypothetical protein
LLSLIIISDRTTNKNNRILRVDAVFTRLSKSKNNITEIINAVVKIIENPGVPLSDTLEKILGSS